MNDDQIDEMIARAVLGELSAEESAQLDAVLAADPARRTEFDAELATAARIQSTTAEQPPPALRQRVLDAIAETAQDAPPPAALDDPQDDDPGPVPASTVAPSPGTVVDLTERRSRRPARLLFAAAAVLAIVIGGAVIAGNRDDRRTPFEAVAAAPDAELRSLEGSLTGSLRVIYSPAEQAIVVDGANLPTLAASETYQLWFVDAGGAATSAGLFRPTDDGRVMERFDDLDPTGFSIGVTIEPAGGSASPTLPIVALA